MSYLVYRVSSHRIVKRCTTEGGAKRSLKACIKRASYAAQDFAVASQEKYDELNVMTTTYNMMDPERKPIAIRKSQLGGCCDPATETYHCM